MECPWASWYADAIVQWKHVSSARYATETIAVRSSSSQASSFCTVVRHTCSWDTNLGTAWWLPTWRWLSWHSPNGLGFAPVCWELRYRDLWMQHCEPAEVVTLAGWISEQGTAAVVEAEGGPHGNPEWLLPARRDMKGVTGRRGLAPWERNVNDKASWIIPSTASILSLIPLANIDGAVRTNPCKSAIQR